MIVLFALALLLQLISLWNILKELKDARNGRIHINNLRALSGIAEESVLTHKFGTPDGNKYYSITKKQAQKLQWRAKHVAEAFSIVFLGLAIFHADIYTYWLGCAGLLYIAITAMFIFPEALKHRSEMNSDEKTIIK
jgi:hypothetical protein